MDKKRKERDESEGEVEEEVKQEAKQEEKKEEKQEEKQEDKNLQVFISGIPFTSNEKELKALLAENLENGEDDLELIKMPTF